MRSHFASLGKLKGETSPCPFGLMRPTDGEESEREGSSLVTVQHIRSLPSHL